MIKGMPNLALKNEHPVFRQFVVFFNPGGTHALAVRKRIDEIERLAGERPFTIIETSPKGFNANKALVEEHANLLGPETLLCIAAGDGTTNQIIEALLTAKLPAKIRRTPILPLWGGNANDLAHMLNGAAYRARLKDILTSGKVIPIHPLQCDLTSRRKTSTYIAACYASLGASGFAATRLNAQSYRKSWLHRLPGARVVHDFIVVVGALMEAPSFAVKEEHQDVRSVYELSFHNGSRMAKLERLPTKLTDEMFYISRFENKKLLSVVPRMIEATRKGVAQNLLRNYASFTTQEESWAQFDGEPVKVPAHTKVQIQLSPRPFYALTTLLTPKDTSQKKKSH
jgi:diacylglycerol kinase family enzyme